MLQMFVPHPSLVYGERIVYTEKVYEFDQPETLWTLALVCGFLQFLLSSALIKQAKFCFYFRRKETLQNKV